MSNIVTWNGTSTFAPGQTPFGFYDSDSAFQTDADRVAKFCATKLGYPLMDVELTSGSFYTCFEEAITTYGNEVYQAIITQNYLSLEGGGTANSLNNVVIKPSLQNAIRISSQYGTEAVVGGNVTRYTGSIDLLAGKQDYDLKTWALGEGITGSIEIRRVFYEAPPAIVRFFDPYAGTGTGAQGMMNMFGFGAYSPGINFMLMPTSADVQRIQAIEFNDQIRRSVYSFELVNNVLRTFPVPVASGSLRFEYYKLTEKQGLSDNDYVAGSSDPNGPITNVFNVPFNNPVYTEINSVGRQWIYRYAAALAKEMLAYVRGKYSTLPVPGSETTLNQGDLLTDARIEKENLLSNLKEILSSTSRVAQLEMKSKETRFLNDTLSGAPMTIFIG